MILRDYLYFNRISITDFANMCNYHPKHIGGYLSGRIKISRKCAQLISQATNNEISIEKLMKLNPAKTKTNKKKK